MAVAIIGPKFYAWDNDTGKPLAFGKVYTYQAGTNTPKATFTAEGGETQNANPVILNGAGYADIFLNGSYKIVVKDADDVEVWTSDPVSDASQLQQEWVRQRNVTQVNTTTFSVDGELTDEYVKGVAVRVKQDSGFVYGTVESTSYVDGKTTVALNITEGGALSVTATYAERALVSFQSLPKNLGNRTIFLGSVSESFAGLDVDEGQRYEPQGFYPDDPLQMPGYVAKANYAKSMHDGFMFVSPTVPPVSEQPGASLQERRDNFLNGVGETDPGGNGVFVAKANLVTAEQYGAFGDGVQKDNVPFVAALNSQAYQMIGKPGATYLLDGQADINSQMKYYLNGAKVRFEFTTQQAGIYAKSNHVEVFGGTIEVVGSAGAETGGDGHSLNCVTSGVQGDGSGWKRLKFHDLHVTTNRTDAGAHIGLLGECSDFEIYNITVPDNAVCRNIIGCEWGGTPEGGTGHPHNGKIYNINIGNITTPTYGNSGYAYAVWLSAAFNIEVKNVYMQTGYGLLMATRGDNANTYAPARYKNLVGTGITFKNLAINSFYGYALRVIGSYKSATLDETPFSVQGQGLSAIGGKVGANNNIAIGLEQCFGVNVKGIHVSGSLTAGLNTATNVYESFLDGGEIRDSDLYGASFGNGAVSSGVRNMLFAGNNQLNGSGTSTPAVVINESQDTVVESCTFGVEGQAESQKYSVYASNAARRPRLNNNHTYALAAGGVAYLMGLSSDTVIDAIGMNNTAEESLTAFGGAPIFQVMANGDRVFTAGSIPTNGTYKRGDRMYYPNPAASSFIGAVCVADGSPGTWKNWGSIAA